MEFRNALSRLASGVTVVTTRDNDERLHGITVSAFCSVSLEPPLVLICIDKTAWAHEAISDIDKFAVNILSNDQEDISSQFAAPIDDRFAGIPYSMGEFEIPLLDGCIAHLECSVRERYDGGDHTIFLGLVEASNVYDGDPLLYFRSGYRSIS